jgi:hypothetical protein
VRCTRPELSWRDVQWLVVNTSIVVQPTAAGWQVNAAGYAHHEQIGFGVLDAWRLVDAARTWPLCVPAALPRAPLAPMLWLA